MLYMEPTPIKRRLGHGHGPGKEDANTKEFPFPHVLGMQTIHDQLEAGD